MPWDGLRSGVFLDSFPDGTGGSDNKVAQIFAPNDIVVGRPCFSCFGCMQLLLYSCIVEMLFCVWTICSLITSIK